MMNDNHKLRAEDPSSVQVLRNILTAAEAAYEPDDWDGRLWADPSTTAASTVPMLWTPYPIRRPREHHWHNSRRILGVAR